MFRICFLQCCVVELFVQDRKPICSIICTVVSPDSCPQLYLDGLDQGCHPIFRIGVNVIDGGQRRRFPVGHGHGQHTGKAVAGHGLFALLGSILEERSGRKRICTCNRTKCGKENGKGIDRLGGSCVLGVSHARSAGSGVFFVGRIRRDAVTRNSWRHGRRSGGHLHLLDLLDATFLFVLFAGTVVSAQVVTNGLGRSGTSQGLFYTVPTPGFRIFLDKTSSSTRCVDLGDELGKNDTFLRLARSVLVSTGNAGNHLVEFNIGSMHLNGSAASDDNMVVAGSKVGYEHAGGNGSHCIVVFVAVG